MKILLVQQPTTTDHNGQLTHKHSYPHTPFMPPTSIVIQPTDIWLPMIHRASDGWLNFSTHWIFTPSTNPGVYSGAQVILCIDIDHRELTLYSIVICTWEYCPAKINIPPPNSNPLFSLVMYLCHIQIPNFQTDKYWMKVVAHYKFPLHDDSLLYLNHHLVNGLCIYEPALWLEGRHILKNPKQWNLRWVENPITKCLAHANQVVSGEPTEIGSWAKAIFTAFGAAFH